MNFIYNKFGVLVGTRGDTDLAWIVGGRNGMVQLQNLDDNLIWRPVHSLLPVYGKSSDLDPPTWQKSFRRQDVVIYRYERVSVWRGQYRGAEGVVIAISIRDVYIKLDYASDYAIICTPQHTIGLPPFGPEGGRVGRRRERFISAVALTTHYEEDDEDE